MDRKTGSSTWAFASESSEQSERERLEWLANISTRHADELARLQSAEAEARRQRERLEFLADISTEHEAELRRVVREEVEAKASRAQRTRFNDTDIDSLTEWDEADHPRRGYGPHAGAWTEKGTGGGSNNRANRTSSHREPKSEHERAAPNSEMLELAHAWWKTNTAIEQAERDIKELPGLIARTRSKVGSGGHYAYLNTQTLKKAQRDLETAKRHLPELQKQRGDLEQQYRDSGYDEVPYGTFTPGETHIVGKGIKEVGRAVEMSGTPAGLKQTDIEFDLISTALAAPAILRLGRAALNKAFRKLPAKNLTPAERPPAELPRLEPPAIEPPAANLRRATFGQATTKEYRKTFFAHYPDARRDLVVHHAVEQQVLTKYPGLITEAELHSIENLRGIPNDINTELHLRNIRKEWKLFYAEHPQVTKQQLLDKATEIDNKFGHLFHPPLK
jgi:hypothetical protein